jgi:hypothetical protein
MTYATEHFAYTFEGGLPGGELWTVTLRTVAATGTDDDCADAANQAATMFRAAFNASGGIGSINPPNVTFLKATCRAVSAAGVTTAQGEHLVTVPTAGAQSAQTSPNQTALVATLQTARPGRTGRGRIYLPLLTPIFGPDNDRLATGVAQGVANTISTLIAGLNTALSTTPPADWGPFPIAVQSTVNMAAPPPVISVRVGDVLDTQRRRRNKVVESYSSAII